MEIRCSSDSPRLAGSMVGEFGVNKWGPTISTNFGGSMSGFFQVHGFSMDLPWVFPVKMATVLDTLQGAQRQSFHEFLRSLGPASLVPVVVPPWVTWWSIELLILDVQGYLFGNLREFDMLFFLGRVWGCVSTLKHVGGWFKSGRRISFISKVRQFHMAPSNAQPHNVPRRPSWNSAPGRNTEL